MDSNHRRLRQLSYSQPHLATLVTARFKELLLCLAGTNIELFVYIPKFSSKNYQNGRFVCIYCNDYIFFASLSVK